jgi:hypothetical protein
LAYETIAGISRSFRSFILSLFFSLFGIIGLLSVTRMILLRSDDHNDEDESSNKGGQLQSGQIQDRVEKGGHFTVADLSLLSGQVCYQWEDDDDDTVQG